MTYCPIISYLSRRTIHAHLELSKRSPVHAAGELASSKNFLNITIKP